MKCCWLVLCIAAVFALADGRAQQVKGPGKEILALVRETEAGKDVSKKVAELKKKFSIRTAMRLYNPRARGGFGFGPKGYSIESTLGDLGEDGISSKTLKQDAVELRRVARINLVMAEIIRDFAPEKPFLGRGKKEWQRDVDAMKSASASLLEAIEAGSTKDVQAAAVRINKSCVSCHDGKK